MSNYTLENIDSVMQSMNKELDDIKKVYQSKVSDMLGHVVKDFFEKTPEIVQVEFLGFVPYFNDGDACYYSVHDPYYYKANTPEDEIGDNIYEGNPFHYNDLEFYTKQLNTVEELIRNDGVGLDFVTDRYFYSRWIGGKYVWDINVAKRTKEDAVKAIREIEEEIREFPNRNKAIENFNKLSDFIMSLDTEILESVYGSHTRFILTKDGIEVEEYTNHD